MARQRYKVLKKVDAGGMAEIYLARAQSVGGIEKDVAIKRVLPALTKNERFVNMFLDEARLSMVLTHANIVQVFDVGRSDGTYFIVMEYVAGLNLRRLFQRLSQAGERISVQLAAFIMMEVCKGLAHAHDQRNTDGEPLGIVHRDISPPNILLSRSGEVKITDFGLAKAVTQLEVTDPGIVKGKFSYLSPEAANGKLVDHRADIFAVGILLWEILANRRLFLGKSDMETVELVRKAEIPALSLFNKDVTPPFEAILAKALAREPRERWHSARDLGDALADFLFSNNMKVNSYDLQALIKRLTETDSAGAPEERIGPMIDEEVLSLSMMGIIGEGMRAEGAKPLNDAFVASATSEMRLSVADIWASDPPSDLSSRMDLANLLADHEARRESSAEPSAVTKPKKTGGVSSWRLWALVGGLAVTGAGVAYWLVALGGADVLQGLLP